MSDDNTLASVFKEALQSASNPRIKKVLNKIKAAQERGYSYVIVTIDEEDHLFFKYGWTIWKDIDYAVNKQFAIKHCNHTYPPVIAYLLDNGFTIKYNGYYGFLNNYSMIVSWNIDKLSDDI